VVLLESDLQHAITVCERILQAVSQFPFDFAASQPLKKVSVSIGLAQFPLDGQTPAALIYEADAALYRAKQGGRARYCMARKAEE